MTGRAPLKIQLGKGRAFLKDIPKHEANALNNCLEFEPHHDKTNKMTVRPAKTQISLGIRPVWSVFAVCSIGS